MIMAVESETKRPTKRPQKPSHPKRSGDHPPERCSMKNRARLQAAVVKSMKILQTIKRKAGVEQSSTPL